MTNSHVVEAADDITVRLTDKREFKAKVIGFDKRTDVALLKIEAAALPKITMGSPDQLRVGEWVVAIGSPFGFENSVTAGIVSAKGRSLPSDNYVPFIQTDVAINPGNSGGPLFNLKGEVVGINSQIYSRTGGFMGLSFAIPIDVAMDVVNQLRTQGKISRGWLGIVIQEVDKDLAESFGLSDVRGALIASVEPGSPADKGGLKTSDVVLKFDGKPVQNANELPRLVGNTKPGKRVGVEVWRNGASRELALIVGELPIEKVSQKPDERRAMPANRAGLIVNNLSAAQRKQLGIDYGVLVEEATGPAARAGIEQGDVILKLNNVDIRDAEQLQHLLGQISGGKNIALLVHRGNSDSYVTLKMENK
jgi:serine protease Do